MFSGFICIQQISEFEIDFFAIYNFIKYTVTVRISPPGFSQELFGFFGVKFNWRKVGIEIFLITKINRTLDRDSKTVLHFINYQVSIHKIRKRPSYFYITEKYIAHVITNICELRLEGIGFFHVELFRVGKFFYKIHRFCNVHEINFFVFCRDSCRALILNNSDNEFFGIRHAVNGGFIPIVWITFEVNPLTGIPFFEYIGT